MKDILKVGDFQHIYNQTKNNNQNNNVNIDNANTKPVSQTEKWAQSPYGDLELTKYLYESGLQNVFNDYQKNIATLSQQEQQSLQDAYYMREMSKKYLGQYASNTGVQDVSGNLLDIYSNYQQNVGEIKKNYDTLELNLSNEYQNTKQGYLENMLMNQYQIDVAKLQESERDVMYNISVGNTDGLDNMTYLDKALKDGLITKQTYQGLAGSLQMAEATKLQDIMSPKNPDGSVNENYVGQDYNFDVLVPDGNVDKTSVGYVDSYGNKYFSVKENADKDTEYTKTGYDLFEEWKAKNGEQVPVNGDVIITNDSVGGVEKTVQYIYKGDTWHRLAKEEPITPNEMRLWYVPEDNSAEDTNDTSKEVTKKGENFEVSNEYQKRSFIFDFLAKDKGKDLANSITVNGVKYQLDNGKSFNIDKASSDQKPIVDLFKQVHGTESGIRNHSFVFYDGKFYGYKDGKIYSTNKK